MTETPAVAVNKVNEKALARRIKDHIVGSAHEFFAVVHPGFEDTARPELHGLGIARPRRRRQRRRRLRGPARGRLAGEPGRRDAEPRADAPRPTSRPPASASSAPGWPPFPGSCTWPTAPGSPSPSKRGAFAALARRQARGGGGAGNRGAPGRLRPPCRSFPAGEGGRRDVQRVFIRFDENRCQVSLDSSGELLYKRGRGKFTEGAPLRETLACAVLRAAAVRTLQGHDRSLLRLGNLRPRGRGHLFRPSGQQRPRLRLPGLARPFKPARFRHLREELEKRFQGKRPDGRRARSTARTSIPRPRNHGRASTWSAPVSPRIAEVDPADFFHLHPPAGDPAGVLLVHEPALRRAPGARAPTSPPSTAASATRCAATTPAAATRSSCPDWRTKRRWACRTTGRYCFTMAGFRWHY